MQKEKKEEVRHLLQGCYKTRGSVGEKKMGEQVTYYEMLLAGQWQVRI